MVLKRTIDIVSVKGAISILKISSKNSFITSITECKYNISELTRCEGEAASGTLNVCDTSPFAADAGTFFSLGSQEISTVSKLPTLTTLKPLRIPVNRLSVKHTISLHPISIQSLDKAEC